MNPVRKCPFCLQSDDHPRHVIAVGDAELVPHMDCCASIRNCEVCKAQLDGAGGVEGNPKGDALREHLLTTGPAVDLAGWTAPSDEMKG